MTEDRVYFRMAAAKTLYAYITDGDQLWSQRVDHRLENTPVLGGEVIVVRTQDGGVFGIGADGTPQ